MVGTSGLLQAEALMPTSPLEMRATLMDMGAWGLQIRLILESLNQVMDAVQVHQLALFLSNKWSIREGELAGQHSSVGEEMAEDLLAEDQGEVHDFEGNNDH